MKVKIYPALRACDSEVCLPEGGKLFEINTDYLRKMGLPHFAGAVTADIKLTNIKKLRK